MRVIVLAAVSCMLFSSVNGMHEASQTKMMDEKKVESYRSSFVLGFLAGMYSTQRVFDYAHGQDVGISALGFCTLANTIALTYPPAKSTQHGIAAYSGWGVGIATTCVLYPYEKTTDQE